MTKIIKKITADDLRNLTDAKADVPDRVEALTRLAYWERGKYNHLESTIVGLLKDPSAMVRGAAIKTLVAGWFLEKYVDEAIAILRNDRDEDWSARADAAFALAQYAIHTGKDRDRIVRELVRTIRTDIDPAVQQRAYEEALRIVAPDRDAYSSPLDFDRDRDVDWDVLLPYMEN
jgi:hypothetical protein